MFKPKIELFHASCNPLFFKSNDNIQMLISNEGLMLRFQLTTDMSFLVINVIITDVTGFISISHKQLPDLVMNLKNYEKVNYT